jgi:hypothetical protein
MYWRIALPLSYHGRLETGCFCFKSSTFISATVLQLSYNSGQRGLCTFVLPTEPRQFLLVCIVFFALSTSARARQTSSLRAIHPAGGSRDTSARAQGPNPTRLFRAFFCSRPVLPPKGELCLILNRPEQQAGLITDCVRLCTLCFAAAASTFREGSAEALRPCVHR